MRHLSDFIECELGFATPANTMGMGNPSAPIGDIPGSGDIPVGNVKIKKKNKKKPKDSLKSFK